MFSNFNEAKLAYESGLIELGAEIEVRESGERLKTSVGRIMFNEVLHRELGFRNQLMDKKALKEVVAECYQRFGNEITAEVVDNIKHLGFKYATKSGITIAVARDATIRVTRIIDSIFLNIKIPQINYLIVVQKGWFIYKGCCFRTAFPLKILS